MNNRYLKAASVLFIAFALVITSGYAKDSKKKDKKNKKDHPAGITWVSGTDNTCTDACTAEKMAAVPAGTDSKTSNVYYVCASEPDAGTEYVPGYNLLSSNSGKTCVTAPGTKVVNTKKYVCLCSKKAIAPLENAE